MPSQKDLKRLIRARMDKTGESYTAARAQLLAKKDAAVAAADPRLAEEYAEIAGMSNAAVSKRTGRDWHGWVELLDAANAAEMEHRRIVSILHEDLGVSAWWSQMVTVGYERIRGLREKGQRRDGSHDVNKSKTLGVALPRLYRCFSDVRNRRKWLGDVEIEVRTSRRDKTMRFLWDDGCPVDVYFYAKGDDKSQVTVQHRKLASKKAAAKAREYWTEKLAALAEIA